MLPEMEPSRNAEIERAAAAYVEIRDQRMSLTKEEVGRKNRLMAAMKDANEKTYETEDGLIVEITHKDVEDVRVRQPKDEANGEAE